MTDEIRVPTFDELMQPLLEVLQIAGKPLANSEISKKVASHLQLSSEQVNAPHRPDTIGPTRLSYNLYWTRSYLKSAGYLINVKHGFWTLTETGRKAGTLDTDRIKRDVRTYSAQNGVNVTIPNPQDEEDEERPPELSVEPQESSSEHTKVQWLLLKLGQDMGLKVWIASNDQSKQYLGNHFKRQTALLNDLPVQFDMATQRTIELIDVLWLKDDAIMAAFEIENTSSIYSGLLRMSDLVAMQPNINIPLYIVAPDERQKKVMLEINRPTFSKAAKLTRRCCYISYSRLDEAIAWVKGKERHVLPNFIDTYSEQVASNTNA